MIRCGKYTAHLTHPKSPRDKNMEISKFWEEMAHAQTNTLDPNFGIQAPNTHTPSD